MGLQTPGPSGGVLDHALARFDTTSGKLLHGGLVTVSDAGAVVGAHSVAMNGTSSGTLQLRPVAATTSYTLTLPAATLRNNGSGALSWTAGGDVAGPPSSTDNASTHRGRVHRVDHQNLHDEQRSAL